MEGKEWTPTGSSITLAASYAPQKMKKGGNKWQSKSITWKRIMSPVKYTLCSVSLCFFFSSNGAHFRDWILKTLYIINTLHASSVYWGRFPHPHTPPPPPALFLFCFHETKSNKHSVCSWHLCSFLFIFNIYLLRTTMPHMEFNREPLQTLFHNGWGRESEQEKKREGEDN